MHSRSTRFVLSAALLMLAAGCGVDAISSLRTFDVSQSFGKVETTSDTTGQAVSYVFNGTSPALVRGAKLSRALITSSAHDLARFKDIQLFVSSDSLAELLVGQLAVVPNADSALLDLAPTFAQASKAFAAPTVRIRLVGTLLRPASIEDTLSLFTKFSFIAEPVSAP
jgi:hypothetical protein